MVGFNGQGGGDNHQSCLDACMRIQRSINGEIPACSNIRNSTNSAPNCNSAIGCEKEAGATAQNGADDSKRAYGNANSGAQSTKEAIAKSIQLAQSDLDKQASSIQSMPAQSVADFHADQALLNNAKSDFESGKTISEEYAGLAKNPQLQKDLKLMADFDQAKEGFKTLANDYQIQSQELAKTAQKANENSETLKSIADQKAATAATNAAEKTAGSIVAIGENKSASKDSEADTATKAALARLEKALEKINSKSQRDALRKKFLAKIKKQKGSFAGAFGELDKEVDKIVTAEADEQKKGSPLQSAIRDVASDQAFGDLNIDQAAKNLRDKVVQLEDERAGVLHNDPRTLFQRIHDSHEACQRRSCVNTKASTVP